MNNTLEQTKIEFSDFIRHLNEDTCKEFYVWLYEAYGGYFDWSDDPHYDCQIFGSLKNLFTRINYDIQMEVRKLE